MTYIPQESNIICHLGIKIPLMQGTHPFEVRAALENSFPQFTLTEYGKKRSTPLPGAALTG
jgi:hypothetical protein